MAKCGITPELKGLLAILAIVIATLVLCCWSTGCASNMRLLSTPNGDAEIPKFRSASPPTSQPVANVATQGQIATSIVSQLRSDIDAKLTGIEYNRTVDHALDGGQLLVLLSVIWASHQRGVMRIKNDSKRAGTCL